MRTGMIDGSAGLVRGAWASTLLLLVLLAGCTTLGQYGERDYFPGGVPYYGFGTMQGKENFANIERAQSNYGLFSKERWWREVRPSSGEGGTFALTAYYPLHVRWQLKDGRQFIAENIDIRAIMRHYFASHQIVMPWEKEGRPRFRPGDTDPTLGYEIKDEQVLIKWRITTNHTPVSERVLPSGAATRWKWSDEDFFVTAVPGKPASEINFKQKVELLK